MIKFLKGEVSMYINNALTADELADGWALIRRAVPTTASLRIAYRFEEG
jgi:hypothetical protein